MIKDYENTMPYDDGWKKKSGPLGFRMCNDYLFRAFLQRDEESLKALIASFLQTDAKNIGEVTVTNPIILGEEISDKELHLDVHVVMEQGLQIDFEMQLAQHTGWIERSVLYVCRCIDSLSHGDDYTEIPGVWQISFCNFTLFPEHPKFYSCYMMIDTENIDYVYSDKLRISNIDLTHIDLATERDKVSGVVKWARLFKAETWEELMILAEDDKTIDRAVSSAWQLTEDEKVFEQIRRREENERLWNATVRRVEEAERMAEKRIKEAEEKAKKEAEKTIEEAKQALEKELLEKDKIIAKLKRKLDELLRKC